MASLDSKQLKEGGLATSTLRLTYIVPNDLVYVPFGTLVVDKALGGQNVGLRIPLSLICPSQRTAAHLLVQSVNAESGGSTYKPVGCNQYMCGNKHQTVSSQTCSLHVLFVES